MTQIAAINYHLTILRPMSSRNRRETAGCFWQEAGRAGDMAGVRGRRRDLCSAQRTWLSERVCDADGPGADVTAYLGSYLAAQSMQMCKCDKK